MASAKIFPFHNSGPTPLGCDAAPVICNPRVPLIKRPITFPSRDKPLDDGFMVITLQIFEAFLKCPIKSYLSLHTTEVATWPQELEQIYIRNGWSRLCANIPADQVIIGASAVEAIRERHRGLLIDCALLTSDLEARLHGLEIVPAPVNPQTRYVPIRFVSNEKVSTTDKLLLAFDAFVFSQLSGCRPDRGKLIHGREYTTTAVSLTALYARIKSVIKAITALQANASSPPVVLNRTAVNANMHRDAGRLPKRLMTSVSWQR